VNSNKNSLLIGFTYDLKDDYLTKGFSLEDAAEFDTLETIDGICNALTELGHRVDKIGGAIHLTERLVKGNRWDIVFNISEGVYGIGREAQVPAILDLYSIPYVFSDVLVLALALHKGMTKHVLRDNGVPTAPFMVVNSVEELSGHNLTFPLFVKPVAEGSGKGIAPDSIVYDNNGLERVVLDRLNQFGQSVLIEEFLPGREFTVGIIGTANESEVIGMIEVKYRMNDNSGVYSYFNKTNYEEFIEYSVPEKKLFDACSDVALRAWKVLGCRDGGRIDLRLDNKGVPNFIEVNPLAGLNPVHSDLPILAYKAGISYNQLVDSILQSALRRIITPKK